MKIKDVRGYFEHVETLRKIANLETGYEADELYKKLHRIEAKCSRIFTAEFNGWIDLPENESEKRDAKILKTVQSLLPGLKTIFLNGDPRGYALRIKSDEVKELRDLGISFYTDFGGYGILCPDF